MELFGDLIGLAGSAFTGGVAGIAGFGLKALFAWLGEREKRENLKLTQAHELALLDKQLQARGQEMENQREIAAETTRQASYEFMPVKQEVWKWAGSLVSLMRPVITLYLLVLTTGLMAKLLWGAPVPYVDSPQVVREVVSLVIFLTASSVTWWFGDRPPQKR